jgi:hypothetical protein
MNNLGITERARKLLDAAGRRAWKQEVKNRQSIDASNAKHGKDIAQSFPLPIWMETEARVTECHRELSRVRKFPPRVTKYPDNVIVFFTYYAHARIYYDEFRSPVARTPGEAFSVYYNALNPRQNTLSPSKFVKQRSLSDATMLAITLMSILVLTLVRG